MKCDMKDLFFETDPEKLLQFKESLIDLEKKKKFVKNNFIKYLYLL